MKKKELKTRKKKFGQINGSSKYVKQLHVTRAETTKFQNDLPKLEQLIAVTRTGTYVGYITRMGKGGLICPEPCPGGHGRFSFIGSGAAVAIHIHYLHISSLKVHNAKLFFVQTIQLHL